MEQLNVDDFKAIVASISNMMDEKRGYLTELDSVMGDGDLGITMSRAFTAVREEATKSTEEKPGKLMLKLGMLIAKTAPSTMGTLVATGFMRGGKALEEYELIGLKELAIFFEAFVKGIMERGKSAPGNKTIIDTLFPAAEALKNAVTAGKPLREGVEDAFNAAKNGLEAAKQMMAQHGRAAYYREASIGKHDGGATVGFYIVEGFWSVVEKKGS